MSFPRYPAYKPSGVEWLGEVPEHWEVLPCRAIVDERTEKNETAACQDYLSLMANIGIIPYEEKGDVGNKKPEDLSKCKIVRKDDFVINSMNYGIGSYGVSGYDGVCSPVYIVLTPRQDAIEEGFAFRIFEDKQFQGFSQSFGNGILAHRCAIGWDILKGIGVAVPPRPEQRSILKFLDRETAKIDALIAEQQRLIELLQEKRQAVISHAVTKGLNPDAPMKDSGVEWLGEVPEHWVVKKLKHLLSQPLSYGANEPADSSNPELPRYIRITDIQDDGTLNADTFRSLPAEKAEPYMLIDKDILLARSGATVGKAFLYKREFGPCCFAGYLILARLEARCSLPEWFRLFTESSAYWGQVKSDAIQATIQNVSAEKYGNILIPVPPKDELVGIVLETKSLVECFERTVSAAMRSISLLQERRSALISAAVTGQIDVRGLVPNGSAA